MEISLSPESQAYIDEQLASGRYSSVDEIIDDGLRKLHIQESISAAAQKEEYRENREFKAAKPLGDIEIAGVIPHIDKSENRGSITVTISKIRSFAERHTLGPDLTISDLRTEGRR